MWSFLHPYLRPISLNSPFHPDRCDTYHSKPFFYLMEPYPSWCPYLPCITLASSCFHDHSRIYQLSIFFSMDPPLIPSWLPLAKKKTIRNWVMTIFPFKKKCIMTFMSFMPKWTTSKKKSITKLLKSIPLQQFMNKFQSPSSSSPPLYTGGIDSNQPLHSHSVR